jgi:hypothetical protein
VRLAPGVAPDRVVVTVALDPYLPLTALAGYAGLSVRKLREFLADPAYPLPCYRVGGKLLVRRSEFDTWIAAYRQRGRVDLNEVVDDVLRGLT